MNDETRIEELRRKLTAMRDRRTETADIDDSSGFSARERDDQVTLNVVSMCAYREKLKRPAEIDCPQELLKEAIASYQRCLELMPEDSDAVWGVALSYGSLARLSEDELIEDEKARSYYRLAIEWVDRFLDASPFSGPGWYNRGVWMRSLAGLLPSA